MILYSSYFSAWTVLLATTICCFLSFALITASYISKLEYLFDGFGLAKIFGLEKKIVSCTTKMIMDMSFACLLHWITKKQLLCYFFILATLTTPINAAGPIYDSFPNILFSEFSEFITENFSSKITLSTVLCVLFSLTDNPELLNLHARQKHKRSSKQKISVTNGWIKALARGIETKLDNKAKDLIPDNKIENSHIILNTDKCTSHLAKKLNKFADILALSPYHDKKYVELLKPISYEEIQGVPVLCPISMCCQTESCNEHLLLQKTKPRDVPTVTVIQGITIHTNGLILTGECGKCKTKYMPDHESYTDPASNERKRFHLNNARFVKVGQNLWVDRIFSLSVLNGVYSFHASTQAYMEFWNNTFGFALSYRQVWKAFVQESIRLVASLSETELETSDTGLNTENLVSEAYNIIGNDGIINIAKNHECIECAQPYKAKADKLPNIQNDNASSIAESSDDNMDVDNSLVKMVVLDGIVMGPTHCAYPDCSANVRNLRGGAFCSQHEAIHGTKCRVVGCESIKIRNTQACANHQQEWAKYQKDHSRENLSGVRRILRRKPNEVPLPWQPKNQQTYIQLHDEEADDVDNRKNYFGPSRFYCVETMCAPCGVVIAWTKFVKSESPSNILKFMDKIYPTEDSKPAYVCIDKACLVLKTAVHSKKWDQWKNTTRFIVDSYHYTNHQAKDYLCRKWCNPNPMDGSAPNLVVVDPDGKDGAYYKRAFNTQVKINLYLFYLNIYKGW